MVVNQCGWGKFLQQPIRASLKVVYKFYIAMVPEEFLIGSPVYVKGHRVEMSVKVINEYYGLETDVNHIDEKDVVVGGSDLAVEQPIPPLWAATMLISLERRLDGLKGDINDRFDNLDACVGAIKATLAASQFGQGQMETEASSTHHAH
ncbi:hypothetical protein ACOSP7_027004 [Xanthoceras sorbifolium]